jgi:twitching motility protein PilT
MFRWMNIETLLAQLVQMGGSDLHLKEGSPPIVRVDGALSPLDLPPVSSQDIEGFIHELLPPVKRGHLEETGDAELGLSVDRLGRFRVNAFRERGQVRFVIRSVPMAMPTLAELNLPESIGSLAQERRGLILVTGNQREVGIDVVSYAAGMKYVVRQDPDVIFIGEIRDPKTAEAAIQAAETGHLVISTMHTIDATETVDRMIDLFPPERQHQVRLSLAGTLRGVVCQRLLPRTDGTGRVPAVELMVVTGRIRERILDPARTGKIAEVIKEGGYYGMQTFDQSLMSLLMEGLVSMEDARAAATSPHDFALAFAQASLD